jgi:hypothetical protein
MQKEGRETNAELLDVGVKVEGLAHGLRGSLAHAVEDVVVALLLGLKEQVR